MTYLMICIWKIWGQVSISTIVSCCSHMYSLKPHLDWLLFKLYQIKFIFANPCVCIILHGCLQIHVNVYVGYLSVYYVSCFGPGFANITMVLSKIGERVCMYLCIYIYIFCRAANMKSRQFSALYVSTMFYICVFKGMCAAYPLNIGM